MQIPFEKMQGSGNDFIMIDNRSHLLKNQEKVAFVKAVCPRATAVGADGVIFLEDDEELDFAWHFFNADGSEAEMCGNGARCMAVFAHNAGVAGETMTFRTLAGPIHARLVKGGARVTLTDADLPIAIPALPLGERASDGYFINTGVPHVVMPVESLEALDIRRDGAAIRYHNRFAPDGSNVNFVTALDHDHIAVRTYERGVEDETLACGTGSVASAIVAQLVYGMSSPITVQTRSGIDLIIRFTLGRDIVSAIHLEGPALRIYSGLVNWG